ncbi:MAG TPA: response regulator [Candidatus Chromulinivoraceae bacterium]|nr:response regulator [Candidatus Chromulinivoraceae bacterium]
MTKILLVEDDKSLREIYGVRLLAEGYDIISAGDGEAALAMAIKERPSLIVSDVMMPKISGFDMLDILRSTTETKDIKVIMMTALSSEDQRARGEALGADRYLVKSQVGIEDVVRTVHDVLGDAPVSSTSAAQTFGSMSAPRPAPTTAIPTRPAMAAPQASQTMPIAPPPFNATAAPQPQVQHMPQMTAAPAAPANALPQPTAPFSTTRPANLGERVIHPISQPAGGARLDIGSLMEQELNQAPTPQPTAPQQQPQPQQPAVQMTQPVPNPLPPPPPAPSVPLQASPPMQGAQPTPMPMPQPQQPRVEMPEPSGISFEETPRPMPTPIAPQPPRGPQPPQV